MTRTIVAVTAQPLDVAAHLSAVEDETAGAVVSFIGQIRDHAPDATGEVTGITYSAHPDAESVLERIVSDLTPSHGARIAVSHRIGDLAVGDLALVACVATAHRAEAYELSRRLVEAIKAELPIWKKQYTRSGDANWVGL